MAQAQTLEGHRPASWEDAITAIANANGIPAPLAIAVAKRESKLDPNAVGDTDMEGGPSTGLFQLRPNTAKMLGVDPADPIQNITGGVKYLKQLSDRFGGDVQKTLMAYNGGPEHIEAGDVSPAAQAYAAAVIAELSSGLRTTSETKTPPVLSAPASPPTTLPAASKIEGMGAQPSRLHEAGLYASKIATDLLSPLDPRTQTGRENLVGAGSALAMTAATEGLGALPWIARVLGPAIAAGTGGATERAVEETIGTAPSEPLSVAKAGGAQTIYELFGQAGMWPIRHFGKMAVASRVGREASATLKSAYTAVKTATRDAADAVRAQGRAAVDAARAASTGLVDTVTGQASDATRRAAQVAADALARADVETADRIAQIGQQYDKLIEAPPSIVRAGESVRDVVAGLGGIRGEGPAKRALTIAGEAVKKAAKEGPDIDVSAVKAGAQGMASEKLPTSILERNAQKQAERAPQILPAKPGQQALPPAVIQRQPGDKRQLSELIAEYERQLRLPAGTDHPLPRLLGEFQQEADVIPFEEAHKWKMLLDSAVNWDHPEKDLVLQMTKGLRNSLRQAMSGYEPYEVATQAYANLMPLYYEGLGDAIIKAVADNPAKVVRLLKPEDPQGALALRNLLVGQSAAGGDAAMGEQAWNALRSAYTHEQLAVGGIDKLSQRVHELVEQRPEFARVVFGDATGQQVLSNLDRIGTAFNQAVLQRTDNLATIKAIGEAGKQQARDAAAAAIKGARRQGATSVRQVSRAAQDAVTQVQRENAAARQSVSGAMGQLDESSLRPFTSRRAFESEAANVLNVAKRPSSVYGSLGALRLLVAPKASEIVEWAALSTPRTQRMVSFMLDPKLDRALAQLVRSGYSSLVPSKPVASHSPSQQ